MILYLLDDEFFIYGQRLPAGHRPVAIFTGGDNDEFFVESVDAEGDIKFLMYRLESDEAELTQIREIDYPAEKHKTPVIRIGRIAFPLVVESSISDSRVDGIPLSGCVYASNAARVPAY